MAIFISDLDAFDKIQQLEGPLYVDKRDSYSFSTYFGAWYEFYQPYQDLITPKTTVTVDDGDGTIHGMNEHRYTVMGNGEIIFNPGTDSGVLENAHTLGFNTGVLQDG